MTSDKTILVRLRVSVGHPALTPKAPANGDAKKQP